MIRIRLLLALTALLLATTGCSVNQVTGERQLSMPMSEQIALGSKQYMPAQQQQGGRYVVDPDLNVYVNRVGKAVAQPSPVNLPYEFVVLNSDIPNAWALPGGKIAINRGLLVLLEDEAQLAAVLGHEVVHAAAEHSATQMRKQQILGVGVVLAGVAATQSDNKSALLVATGAVVGAQAYQAHYGRKQELQADDIGINYMVAAGYDPRASIELQETFVKLSAGGQSNFFSQLFASHPPSQNRVDRNRAKAEKLPTGKRNQAAFQRAIAQVKKDQPAYDLHTKALKAVGDKDYANALTLTNKAIKKQPNESLFYVTKGQLLAAQKNDKGARDAFAKAARLNPEYFMSQLGLGVSEVKLKNFSNAKQSLQKSVKLLPTSLAIYNLGEIEEKQGNRQQAIEYYKQAATENSDIGKAAQQKLKTLGANQ